MAKETNAPSEQPLKTAGVNAEKPSAEAKPKVAKAPAANGKVAAKAEGAKIKEEAPVAEIKEEATVAEIKEEAPVAEIKEEATEAEAVTPVATNIECDNCSATPPTKRKVSKKQMVLIIIAAVLAVIIIVSSLTIKFTMFNDLKYDIPQQDNGIISLKEQNKLLFQDDFTTFDDTVWRKEAPESPRRGGYWSADQVFVEDSNLVIRTEMKNGAWHTGAVTSTGSKGDARRYGYYETRCMLPAGHGIWSAFWLMPVTSKFSTPQVKKEANIAGSEIDIFESPMWPAQKVQQAVHNGGYDNPLSTSHMNPRWLFKTYEDLYTKYHTYGLYWDENVYKFYVDDVCVWTTNCGNNIAQVEEFMFLSVEIGGKDGLATSTPWFGAKTIGKNKEGDAFKADLKVDYVKIWDIAQKK